MFKTISSSLKPYLILAGILLSLYVICQLFLFITFYFTATYRKPVSQVHETVTPQYEEEAAVFYWENEDLLTQLAALCATIELDPENEYGGYGYNFHVPELDTSHPYADDTLYLSEDILDILYALEASTEEQYSVFLSPGSIQFWIATGTFYDVSLFYNTSRSINPEWDKITPLENGWEIWACYTARG